MPILFYDPTVKKHILQLQTGSWANKRWTISLKTCINPCCGCRDINCSCILEECDSPAQSKPLNFTLDVGNQCVDQSDDLKMSADSKSLAEAVVSEMDEEVWKYLNDFLMSEKKEQIDHCDPRGLQAVFPPSVLSGEASVVGYAEIFPLAPLFTLSYGSEHWAAIDNYCVDPQCTCRDVILQFISYVEGQDPEAITEELLPEIHHNYLTQKFHHAQEPESARHSLQELFSELKKQHPELETEVRKRHQQLKAVFKNALSKNGQAYDSMQPGWDADYNPLFPTFPETAPALKFGRNDPCPCGSGKKYKKCCGR
jgi:uncharacterized protein YchJ